MAKFKITYNAPVVLTFAILAIVAHVVPELFGEEIKRHFIARPFLKEFGDYLALFTHILGHANWEHYLSNFMMILLLGPLLEEKYGSGSFLGMILVTALVTGLINAFFLDTFLLGASGIVFMCILLASTVNIRKNKEIPLSFIAVAVIFLGGEIVRAFDDDAISQMAHLVGGVVGAGFGFLAANLQNDDKPPKAKLPSAFSPP